MIINGCDKIEMKHAELVSTCYSLYVRLKNESLREDLKSVIDYIKDQPPEFTADGFFTINRRLFSSFSQVIVTYLIVIVQLRSVDLNGSN